jgi:hypothetical protein
MPEMKCPRECGAQVFGLAAGRRFRSMPGPFTGEEA